ncbi:MAG: nucleotidyltransferase domain-containing protein [Candidatus Portnoybacteria bacterium]|nr:nucleotidyltransferase domain-containing protein [Candidatus Portnoybacteria bacterium]
MKLSTHIKRQLEQCGVLAVYLFGSHAQGVAGALSDRDIAILLKDSRIIGSNSFPLYEKLYDVFSELFPQDANHLDIVFLHRAPLELQFDVIRYGKVIFDASPNDRLDYEERVMLAYADFRPLLEELDQAVLSRIS